MSNTSTATVALVAVGLVASLLVAGVPLGQELASEHADDGTAQDTSYLRVVHASPDAPAVDVLVDGEEVLGDVPFGAVSDYLELPAGTYNVSITAADDPDTVVFDGAVTLDPRTVTTVAASGEVSPGADTEFAPVLLSDDALAPGEEEAALRVVHLSPDVPTVDVTTTGPDGSTVVLAENVSFRNASDYVTVPAGNYTVDIRTATDTNDGEVLTSVDVTLEGGTVYSAMAVGYRNTVNAPAPTAFEVLLPEDAETTITLPSDETPTEAPADTETGTATEAPAETETATGTATGTETATETEEATGTETATETEGATGTATETATGTEGATETEGATGTATETAMGTETPTPTEAGEDTATETGTEDPHATETETET